MTCGLVSFLPYFLGKLSDGKHRLRHHFEKYFYPLTPMTCLFFSQSLIPNFIFTEAQDALVLFCEVKLTLTTRLTRVASL